MLLPVIPLLLRALLGMPLRATAASYGGGLYGSLASVLGPTTLLLSIGMGVASAYLVHRLFRKDFLVLLFVLNPLFITVFSTTTVLSLIIPLVLLGMYLVEKQEGLLPVVVFYLSLLSPLTAGMFALWYFKKGWLAFIIWIPSLTRVALEFSVPFLEFGHVFGASLFLLFLSWIELMHRIRDQPRVVVGMLLLTVVGLFNIQILVLVTFAAVYFSFFLLARLARRKWVLPGGKYIMSLLVACIFLFLFLAQVRLLAVADPSPSFVAAMDNVQQGVVLAPAEIAPLVAAYTGFPTYTPSTSLYASWRYGQVEPILAQHAVSYIVTTEKIRSQYPEGVVLLLENAEEFQRVAYTDTVEVWRVTALRDPR